MLAEYLERPADYAAPVYDRSQTVGASEIGRCARQVWFGKQGTKPDPEYVEGWGFMDRGLAVERWAVERMLANKAPLTHALDDQVTLVDGFISATPDGLWDGRWSIDIKSFDPRKTRIPEPAHVMQVEVAANLWKRPGIEGGILLYINASDYADRREFVYPLRPKALTAAKERARSIMSARSHTALPAEGWIAQECDRCQFVRQCVGMAPSDKGELPDDAKAEIDRLTAAAKVAKDQAEAAKVAQRAALAGIANILRTADVRRVPGLARMSVNNGKQSLDTEAMEKAGIDLSLYRKAGRPSETITLE